MWIHFRVQPDSDPFKQKATSDIIQSIIQQSGSIKLEQLNLTEWLLQSNSKIIKAVQQECKIKLSVQVDAGVGPNKLMAQISTAAKKHFRQRSELAEVELRDLPMLGLETKQILQGLGLVRCQDMFSPQLALKVFVCFAESTFDSLLRVCSGSDLVKSGEQKDLNVRVFHLFGSAKLDKTRYEIARVLQGLSQQLEGILEQHQL